MRLTQRRQHLEQYDRNATEKSGKIQQYTSRKMQQNVPNIERRLNRRNLEMQLLKRQIEKKEDYAKQNTERGRGKKNLNMK